MFRRGEKPLGLLVSVGFLVVFLLPAAWCAEKVQLNWWTLKETETGPYFEAVIKSFEQQHPNVQVNWVATLDGPYKTKIRVAVGSDEPPDVFFTWPGDFTGKFVRAGQALDLTDALREGGWRENFMDAAITPFTFGGKVYAVPNTMQVKYFFYLPSIFAKVGVSPPKTWDDLLDVCAKVKKAGIIPIAQGNLNRWPGCHWISILNQKLVGEDQIFKDYHLQGSPEDLFTAEGYVEALTRLKSLQDKGFFNKGINALTMAEGRMYFLTEQAAMFYGGSWNLPIFAGATKEVDPSFIKKISFFRMPDIPKGLGDSNYILGAPAGYLVASKSKHPEEAIAFVRHLTSIENQKLWVKMVKRPGATKGTVTKKTAPFPILVEIMQDVAKASGTTEWLDTTLEISISTDYLNSIQALLNNTMTPGQVMEVVRKKAQEVQSRIGSITY